MIFLVNIYTLSCFVLSWKAAAIRIVCREVKAAETRSLNSAIDESIYFRDIFERTFGWNLKITCFTDSKGLKDSLYSTTLIQDKSLRSNIAYMKQRMLLSDVSKVIWIDTKLQLADFLTKKGVQFDYIKEIFKTGRMPTKLVQDLFACEELRFKKK